MLCWKDQHNVCQCISVYFVRSYIIKLFPLVSAFSHHRNALQKWPPRASFNGFIMNPDGFLPTLDDHFPPKNDHCKKGPGFAAPQGREPSVILLLDICIIYVLLLLFLLYVYMYYIIYIYMYYYIYIHNMYIYIYIYLSSNKKCGWLVLNPHTLWYSNMAVCRLCRELARSEQRTEVPSRLDTSPPAIGPQSLRIAMSWLHINGDGSKPIITIFGRINIH